MKLAILTTETVHHAYFVRELQSVFDNVSVFCETQAAVQHSFETRHSFEDLRDALECDRWFGGKLVKISEFASVQFFPRMNEPKATDALRKEAADAVIVFGTGLLKQTVIDACPPNLFNLHGGDPEEYRGLDTHLWAIYHNDYRALITTLHRLDAGLDTGDIVLQERIPLCSRMLLQELRALNTEVCVKLALSALDMLERHGSVLSRPQRHKGRYYSAMPADLKTVCLHQFTKYIEKLEYDS